MSSLTVPRFVFNRVEKKERARLKTVKFHARTGMIESNRVSVEGQLLPALVPERLSSELLLGSQGDGLLPPRVWERDQHLLTEASTKSAHITAEITQKLRSLCTQ